MSEAPTLSNVKKHSSDKHLVAILKKVLPERLRRMGLSKQQIERTIDEMANRIVKHARSCNESHLIGEFQKVNLVHQPSPEQSQEFYDAVDQIIRSLLTDKRLKRRESSTARFVVGYLWKALKVDLLGIEERGDQAEGNAAVGIRG